VVKERAAREATAVAAYGRKKKAYRSPLRVESNGRLKGGRRAVLQEAKGGARARARVSIAACDAGTKRASVADTSAALQGTERVFRA